MGKYFKMDLMSMALVVTSSPPACDIRLRRKSWLQFLKYLAFLNSLRIRGSLGNSFGPGPVVSIRIAGWAAGRPAVPAGRRSQEPCVGGNQGPRADDTRFLPDLPRIKPVTMAACSDGRRAHDAFPADMDVVAIAEVVDLGAAPTTVSPTSRGRYRLTADFRPVLDHHAAHVERFQIVQRRARVRTWLLTESVVAITAPA
jgi:hypothetical protein